MTTYILETWAVYKYGDAGLGFAGWGLNDPDAVHYAFQLDSDPQNFFDTTYRNQ